LHRACSDVGDARGAKLWHCVLRRPANVSTLDRRRGTLRTWLAASDGGGPRIDCAGFIAVCFGRRGCSGRFSGSELSEIFRGNDRHLSSSRAHVGFWRGLWNDCQLECFHRIAAPRLSALAQTYRPDRSGRCRLRLYFPIVMLFLIRIGGRARHWGRSSCLLLGNAVGYILFNVIAGGQCNTDGSERSL